MITRDEILKIATLSRLHLSEEEIEKYQTELSGILGFFEKLSEVNTQGIEPTSQVTGLQDCLREDDIIPFKKGDLLHCSSLPTNNNQVIVPSVF